MKKITILSCLVMLMSLCACGSKPQPTPTAAPTAVPTEVPAEVPAEVPTEVPAENAASEETPKEETAANAEGAAEATPDTYDPESFGSIYAYYDARGENIFGSYAFLQLDTEGKTTWTAPMAGIQEFKVPETFLNAKGGIRAGGGQELFFGYGIVTMDVVYIPFTETEYNDLIGRIGKFVEEHEDLTDEDLKTYANITQEYHDNIVTLFQVMGVPNNASLEELKTTLTEISEKNDIPAEDIEEFFGHEFILAGSADDYNFYMIRFDREDNKFTESQAEYKEEYNALYDAFESYVPNFTFMRPLGLMQMVSEGTGLNFETKDLNGNTVIGSELFASHKATMLNIWETTCSACMSEMPELNKMAEEFEAKGGQLVGLVYDAADDELIAEAKDISVDLKLNFVNLIPTQEMKELLKVQAFPTTYFFNEKGEIVGDAVMGASPGAYTKRMNDLLGE